jgi:hypothetical protein
MTSAAVGSTGFSACNRHVGRLSRVLLGQVVVRISVFQPGLGSLELESAVRGKDRVLVEPSFDFLSKNLDSSVDRVVADLRDC